MAYLYPVPNNNACHKRYSFPHFLRGYDHFWYANLDEPINDSDFDDWVLSLYDVFGNLLQANVGVLQKDIVGSPSYRFYSTININTSVSTVAPAVLIIYNSTDEVVKYISNPIRIISNDQTSRFVLWEFRNSTNMFNFNYEAIADYSNYFLELDQIDDYGDFEIENNNEETTGITYPLKSRMKKVIVLQTEFFDSMFHDAMNMCSVHDDLKINGNIVTVKTGYKKDQNKSNSLARGIIELFDEQYSTINLHE